MSIKRFNAFLLLVLLLIFDVPAGGSGPVVGALSPHHDVAGALMDRLYERLRREAPSPRRVVLIGPDHFGRCRSNIVFGVPDWSTPWGTLRGDAEGAAFLSSILRRQDEAARQDHCVAEHVPRVRRTFGDAPALSLLVKPGATDLQILRASRALQALLRDGGVVILSMDLSHYKPRAEADREDARSLAALCAFRTEGLNGLDVDCPRGARLFLTLMRSLGNTRALVLERGNSDDFLPSPSPRTTGYAAVLFTREGQSAPPLIISPNRVE